MIISHTTCARMGLMGNPSDGFGGKTITVQIQDFAARTTLWESPHVQIIPHRVHDPFNFNSLEQLYEIARQDGYYGGTRLIYASCKRFYQFCRENDIAFRDANFTIEYDTDIPRQVGLGGSSAIVVATLKALMKFYELSEDDIPRPLQPEMALSVETDELDIKAGLQDRVAQTYGGLVYMDFAPELVESQGFGDYRNLPLDLLPPLYLAYIPHSTTTSGKAHNLVHYRFDSGDREVIEAMRRFASFTDEALEALENRDVDRLGELMDQNFDLRRKIYGDEVIGAENLEMVEIARSFGMSAKFTGSGGAITGILRDEDEVEDIGGAFEERGYRFMRVTPAVCEEPSEARAGS